MHIELQPDMPIITLTSDWGLRDHFLAVVKGKIVSKLPSASIIDISHEISPFNLKQASFVIRNSYPHFPQGTIHMISILTDHSETSPHLAVQYDGQYFIAADNGIFSLIFDHDPQHIIRLDPDLGGMGVDAPGRDRFIHAAVHLAGGNPIEALGEPVSAWKEQMHFQPVVSGDVIRGVVIYINKYENVVTNIKKELFNQVGRDRKFSIEFRGEALKRLHTSYQQVPVGEIVALFGSTGHLEIAINQGNASSLLGLDINDPVRIEFKG
jgi:S-adenosyl-L-methionine hydrolase (adenosine-forming)